MTTFGAQGPKPVVVRPSCEVPTGWRFGQILRIAQISAWDADLETDTVRWTPGSGKLLGVPDDALGDSFDALWKHIHADERDRVISSLAMALSGRPFDETYRVLRPEGGWLRARGEVIVTPDGSRRFVGFVQDVTEDVRSAHAREWFEQGFRALFEESPVCTWVYDADTARFIDVNRAALHHYGYTRSEFLAMHVGDLASHDDPPTDPGLDGESPQSAETDAQGARKHRKKNGTVIEVEVTAHEIRRGPQRLVLAMAEDVTERKRTEAGRLEAQKMEALGRLAGGIAHDFNNILAVILATADCALINLEPTTEAQADVREIARAAKRGAELTRQLLTFSRRHVVKSRVLSLDAILHDMESMLRRVIGEDVTLAVSASSQCCISADRMQIEQVVMNLVVNARDAMPDGGALEIAAMTVELDEQEGEALGLDAGAYVELKVSDTGTGMDETTKRRIFEPFFTTKEVGKGTGLGLSTVFGVVKQCGGAIAVDSTPGFGSSFSIWLPRVPTAALLSDPPRAIPRKARAGATVLVVEDDDQLRAIICRILIDAGFITLEACDGASAIRRVERLGAPVELLVTDLVMPGMDGRSLVTRIRERWPEMSVLYMSGYDELSPLRGAPELDTIRSDEAFLRKPFSADQMREAVDAALGAGRASASEELRGRRSNDPQ